MIISASYKTDIPAFYSDWFQKRLAAGFCKMVNPYNNHVYDVSLRREDVQGYVFWSRNYQPFLDKEILQTLENPFICHLTITGYPRELDQATIPWQTAIDQAGKLSQAFGQDSVVWRYDPIVTSSAFSVVWHKQNFAQIASGLSGSVDEVVVSFVQLYRKTQRNFGSSGFENLELSPAEKQELLLDLSDIAEKEGIRLTLCAQPELLVKPILPSACVDVVRLEKRAGRPLHVSRKPHRKECGCASSKDIGDYNTCPHGCLYCYAVEKRTLAKERFKAHDPHSPFLFEPEFQIEPEETPDLLI